jgi:hypothetical protein
MTVVLCDSIQAKPLPIANAIIHVAVTRLVTAKLKFSESQKLCPDNSGSRLACLDTRLFLEIRSEPGVFKLLADLAQPIVDRRSWDSHVPRDL